VGGSCAGDSEDQGQKWALSGPASTADHVTQWRLATRDRWLTARGPARRGGRPPACMPSPRWRWGEWVAVPLGNKMLIDLSKALPASAKFIVGPADTWMFALSPKNLATGR
jgi:hypothetical protein